MTEKHFMGLRTKILAILSVGMILLFTLLFFVARTELFNGYAQLEKDNTLVYLESASGLIEEQISQVRAHAIDYGHWDDTYEYIRSQDPAYIKANMSKESFANLKINGLILINLAGEIVYKYGVDYTSGGAWEFPEQLIEHIAQGGDLVDPKNNEPSGLYWTPQETYIISSVHIRSELNNKRAGTLIMLRPVNQDLLQRGSKILGVKLDIQPFNNSNFTGLAQALNDKKFIVKPLDDDYVAGYKLMDDLEGSTKLVLSIVNQRKIFEQGKSSLNLFYGCSAVMALLLIVFSWLLDKLILSRLESLSQNVKRIGQSPTAVGRLQALSGNDELTSLTHSINGMLGRIDEAQHDLKFEKERAQVTLAGIADAVITSDKLGYVVYMNNTAERLAGVSSHDAINKPLKSVFKLMNTDKTSVIASCWLTDSASSFDEVVLLRDDGVEFVITKSTSPLNTDDGVLFGHVTVLHDVTVLRSLSTQLSYQARHDALTELVNRYEFEHKVQEAINDASAGDRKHCLAYMDLDQFKVVNDTCGHAAGDKLLQQLADNLKAKVRNADTLARLGGDEFALLLMGCDLEKAQTILEDLLEVVQSFRFTYDNRVFKVGVSIGLMEIAPNQDFNLTELISAADSACYIAKKNGGNRVYAHLPEDNEIIERSNQLEWVSSIHLALEQHHFELYIQRIESLGLSLEQHCELLIRMRGDDGSLYPPSYFLPAAERYHLMPKIDRWVVSEALSIMASKQDSFPYVCAINLSGQTLSEDGFLDYVIEQINLHGVDAKKICFEITETAVIANLNKARYLIHALRAIGCRFSLDDFGSGLSSFGYLKNLEVDFLKIDGMFVKSIVNNKIDRAMVESINNVGHVIGLHTIAEFAENDEIIQILKEIGVDYAQGYGIAKPEPFLKELEKAVA
jgi:diguanylate cyclase (GGDEF)-like protein/PAS domain S-box-containing protein